MYPHIDMYTERSFLISHVRTSLKLFFINIVDSHVLLCANQNPDNVSIKLRIFNIRKVIV